jgi:hypothetical protein
VKRLPAPSRRSCLFLLSLVVIVAVVAVAADFLLNRARYSKSKPDDRDRASRNKRKEAALLESTHRSQRAVITFITNLRSQFANPPQPPTDPAARRDHFLKLARLMKEALPPDLPDDLADPWRDLTTAAATLADSSNLPASPPGSDAAARLNAALAARGFPDLCF